MRFDFKVFHWVAAITRQLGSELLVLQAKQWRHRETGAIVTAILSGIPKFDRLSWDKRVGQKGGERRNWSWGLLETGTKQTTGAKIIQADELRKGGGLGMEPWSEYASSFHLPSPRQLRRSSPFSFRPHPHWPAPLSVAPPLLILFPLQAGSGSAWTWARPC